MSSNNNQNNIYPKPCNYGCNTQIYWNTSENTYFEVFTKKKHICPNRTNKQSTTVTNRPTYYSKKPWSNTPKAKMSNSFELLTGPIETVQKKYEMLSDIVSEHNGKVHGSQRDRDPKTSLIDLLVYYEVPLGQRDEVKRKFDNYYTRNLVLNRNI
ncbi:MAG: hypothetical protein ACR2F1_12050 [Nitrososphaeraceae archaeon]